MNKKTEIVLEWFGSAMLIGSLLLQIFNQPSWALFFLVFAIAYELIVKKKTINITVNNFIERDKKDV